VVEVGQLRVWKKRHDGGQFYNIAEGTLCLVTQCFDNGTDEIGNQRPRTFTVMMDNESPWFYDLELEEHKVMIGTQAGDLHGN
jgi:hypothetical protein